VADPFFLAFTGEANQFHSQISADITSFMSGDGCGTLHGGPVLPPAAQQSSQGVRRDNPWTGLVGSFAFGTSSDSGFGAKEVKPATQAKDVVARLGRASAAGNRSTMANASYRAEAINPEVRNRRIGSRARQRKTRGFPHNEPPFTPQSAGTPLARQKSSIPDAGRCEGSQATPMRPRFIDGPEATNDLRAPRYVPRGF
jgi:hypothetical protein